MTINRCIGLHHTAVIHTAAHRANKKLQPITVSVLFTQGLTVALRNYVRSIHSLFTVLNTPIDWIMIREKQSTNLPRPFVTRHSLVRAKGEVFVLLHVFCSLFCQRFLDNPRADSSQILLAGVFWFRMCLLPFWG